WVDFCFGNSARQKQVLFKEKLPMSNNRNRGRNRTASRGQGKISFMTNEGLKAQVGLDQVRQSSSIRVYHGQALDGTQVNSMASKTLGRNIVIGKSKAFREDETISVPENDAIVFAQGLLTDKGFTVTAPATNQA